jgi:hypothetical protein
MSPSVGLVHRTEPHGCCSVEVLLIIINTSQGLGNGFSLETAKEACACPSAAAQA